MVENAGVDGTSIDQAIRSSAAFLQRTLDLDWDRPIPEMTWSVREVVAHVGDTLLWYATDLAGGPRELSTMDLRVRPAEAPAALIETVGTFGAVLGHVVDGVTPGQRGFHPDGAADSTGFAAMACDEILVHTSDAARGLGLEYEPSEVLAGAVLRRLFPGAPRDSDPWAALLWANGRIALPGRPRQVGWHRHAAPLGE
ncbi:maleylpyruvate isomerase N-terminal domain-containing protein [Nakamurella sp.]|uniref:maleylpyruvate isomerase N-terminal domain-containing protein n=1 Tax=Nakamurella sp. TaxID=1869182 RepID=UPI003B3A5CFE